MSQAGSQQPEVEEEQVDVLKSEKYEYIAEVVNEPKIHYW